MPFDEVRGLQDLIDSLPRIRWQFEMTVEAAALEVTEIAKQISSAIGEISIKEAKDAIATEFRKRLD
jgi:hypothetical protein